MRKRKVKMKINIIPCIIPSNCKKSIFLKFDINNNSENLAQIPQGRKVQMPSPNPVKSCGQKAAYNP